MAILRFFGWLFLPFIMIFLRWKKLGSVGKGFAITWTVLFILIGVIVNLGDNGSNDTTAQKSSSESVVGAEVTEVKEVIANVEPKQVETKEEKPKVDEVKKEESKENVLVVDDVPKEYKSALSKAETYAKAMNMSKIAIYDQLTSPYGEKFSEEAAQYAMDNFEFDWKLNALKKAGTYSDTMYMSKKGIYEQLVSEHGEQFTKEEAQYAIDNLETDYKRNALEKAKSYQDSMDMSPEAIRDQLTSEYGENFTKDEADYAIANLE